MLVKHQRIDFSRIFIWWTLFYILKIRLKMLPLINAANLTGLKKIQTHFDHIWTVTNTATF